jgi:enamine deaminase RidA (YjgF/YER057c/UK114 family)
MPASESNTPISSARKKDDSMNFKTINEHIAMSSFSSKNGLLEAYVSISTKKSHAIFANALYEMNDQFDTLLGLEDLSTQDLVFSRVYLSDIENQKDVFRESRLYKQLSCGVLSIIEQPPLSGGSVSLLLYFVKGHRGRPLRGDTPTHAEDPWFNRRLFTGRHYSMFWMANCTGRETFDSAKQTRRLLTQLNGDLELNNLSMKRDLLRTWIYVRDVDNHYKGVVNTRRQFFDLHGLNKDTRYPASTGIEGKAHVVDCLVDMDALAFSGLEEEQVIKMEALDHLSPTIHYGVTFERGIRIRFGDRSHLHISGTASIDKHGEMMYPGDILKQATRTVANMSALLEGHGASIQDMAYIILYLRDSSLFEVVKEYLYTIIPRNIPIVPVKAAVCRPCWLIEMEGVAIVLDNAPYPVFF